MTDTFNSLVGNTWTIDDCSGERALDAGGPVSGIIIFPLPYQEIRELSKQPRKEKANIYI
jgi:hypothetical protein